MTIYMDVCFLLNGLADGLGLYITGKLAGLMVRWRRILVASLAGGIYGVLCSIYGGVLSGMVTEICIAALLVTVTYGNRENKVRLTLLYFLISCAMAGVPMAILQFRTKGLQAINCKVFLLAGSLCYFLLSCIFRGGAKHGISQEILSGKLHRNGQTTELTALYDTGHTLRDGMTNTPVLIVESGAVDHLWTEREREILNDLPTKGAVWCMGQLDDGAFRLLPYRAVGVEHGLLLCCTSEDTELNGKSIGSVTIALSPTPLSECGGYQALWGGEEGIA